MQKISESSRPQNTKKVLLNGYQEFSPIPCEHASELDNKNTAVQSEIWMSGATDSFLTLGRYVAWIWL